MIQPIPPTSIEDLDRAVEDLVATRNAFSRQSIDERLEMIRTLRKTFKPVTSRWVEGAHEAKGVVQGSPAEAEDWLAGPLLIQRNLRLLEEALEYFKKNGKPYLPGGNAVRTWGNGQVIADVFPAPGYDKLLFTGFTASVIMQDDVTLENLQENMMWEYTRDVSPEREGKVALVLGAGNVSSIGPMDVFTKLFQEGQVCILKMNPVNEYFGPLIEEGFKPLVDAGFLRVVYGGAEVGAHLCQHAGIDEIHITGSDKTHDMIVWGPPGDERNRRMEADEPQCTKRITSELGNVSPVVIVPGKWSDSELQFQAENVACMVYNNGSFNCNAAKLLVVESSWPQRAEFLARVRSVLEGLSTRKAYYPGAHQRYQTLLDAYPQADPISDVKEDVIPWTLIAGLDSSKDELAFHMEPFCGVLSETSLDAEDAGDFLSKAVSFLNDRVWGTLNCMVVIDPRTQKKIQHTLDQALMDLRYGTVAVNHWPAVGYGFVVTPWGAHPGHTMKDIQSGIGVVHNTLFFEKVQKTVIQGPFKMFPKPPWFPTHKQGAKIGPKLVAMEESPSLAKALNVISSALRG